MNSIDFLIANGFKELNDGDSEYRNFQKIDGIGISIDKFEIVLIDDSGDFCHMPRNIYALIGALVHFKIIPIPYQWRNS